MDPVEALIFEIRKATPCGLVKYMRGGCFHLFVTLKLAFPDAECWYDHVEGHAYTKINDAFYDIRGKVDAPEHTAPLLDEPRIYDGAFKWVENIL